MGKAIPVGLILNELISNSCKHAFNNEEPGVIKIHLHSLESDKLGLSYSDNGKGIEKKEDIVAVNKYGMNMIEMISKQLDGKMKLRAKDGMKYDLQFEGK